MSFLYVQKIQTLVVVFWCSFEFVGGDVYCIMLNVRKIILFFCRFVMGIWSLQGDTLVRWQSIVFKFMSSMEISLTFWSLHEIQKCYKNHVALKTYRDISRDDKVERKDKALGLMFDILSCIFDLKMETILGKRRWEFHGIVQNVSCEESRTMSMTDFVPFQEG